MKDVCITGGIACGKTTVGLYMKQAGIVVVDADEICRAMMRPGHAVYHAVVNAFGTDIVAQGGEIDRNRLGTLIFDAPERRAELNRLTHPPARAEINRLRQMQSGPLAAIVPLVYEADWVADWPAIICVGSPPDLQMTRLLERGLDDAAARKRLAAQMPIEDKMRRADYVIYNSGSKEALLRQTDRVLKRINLSV